MGAVSSSWEGRAGAALGLASIAVAAAAGSSSAAPLRERPASLVGVAAACSVVAVARRLPPATRRGWTLVGLGALASVGGDLVWTWYSLVLDSPAPFPGPPDVLYLAAYPLWAWAVLSFPADEPGRFDRPRLILDAAAGAVGIVMLIVYLSPRLALPGLGAGPAAFAVGLAYPLGDLVLLLSALVLVARTGRYRGDVSLLALSVGLLLTAVADFTYSAGAETYAMGAPYDGLWLASYGCLALGAAVAERSTPREVPARRAVDRFTLLPYAPVVVAVALAAAEMIDRAPQPRAVLLVIGPLVLLVLVAARQALSLAEIRRRGAHEQREIIASLTHEIRTPLTAVTGFTAVLADEWTKLGDAEREKMLGTVASEADHLASLVGDLIDATRPTGRTPRTMVVPVTRIVDEALRLSDPAAETTVEVHERLAVHVEPGRVTRAVVNLVKNADHYGGGSIVVRAVSAGLDAIRIEVHDNGPGIPVRYRDVVWELFERGTHRFDAASPGLGTGLAITRAIVTAHGGRVGYEESPILGGACFVLVLPSAPAPPPKTARGSTAAQVDDRPANDVRPLEDPPQLLGDAVG